MERTITRNLLKHAAGHAMFCPLCNRVLDAPTTVLVQAGEVIKTLCAPCYDTELLPKLKARPGLFERCEITDGRFWFGKGAAKARDLLSAEAS
jgi:hypothetical protein